MLLHVIFPNKTVNDDDTKFHKSTCSSGNNCKKHSVDFFVLPPLTRIRARLSPQRNHEQKEKKIEKIIHLPYPTHMPHANNSQQDENARAP
ncbi:unnamed protein product [Periconia digitata]|uniref:Uncharacterized protein n=1 Tax=Periconia digitata TaxID=1303443 RepID=A0A9W4UTT0_9PLEO|nr:unnamed protein product [Periconia digitata]